MEDGDVGGFGFMIPIGRAAQKLPENPAEYPRSVRITDGDALMATDQIKMLIERRNRLLQEVEALDAEMQAVKARLWVTLDKLHPGIKDHQRAGSRVGWREFDADNDGVTERYYIGWDG